MLEDMITAQGNRNIFVFPDTDQLLWEFLIAKVIFNITEGKIGMTYDPYRFRPGQKLKYMNCVVEFVKCGLDESDKRERIFFRVKEGMIIGVPISRAPYFQVVETKRLSTYNAYRKALKENANVRNEILKQLNDHKTHLDSSVCFVSEIKSAKEFLSQSTLDGEKITDILYVAHVNGDGELSNLSPGQMTGNPAIIIAADLYSVLNALMNGVRIQSVIFDASRSNAIEKQLDAFDELNQYDFPIVCITNTANSFDNGLLVDRGYNEWRWDKDSIPDSLYDDLDDKGNFRVRHCAQHRVKYKNVNGTEVSEAIRLLYKHKSEIEVQSATLIYVVERLFSLVFFALRNAIPIDQTDRVHYLSVLSDCSEKLEREKIYIADELYNDISFVVRNLEYVLNCNFSNKKYQAICDLLKEGEYQSACIVISDKQDKSAYIRYWTAWCSENNCETHISVMYPHEYIRSTDNFYDVTIVVGWLSDKIMRSILFRFNSADYFIILYQYEERWREAHTRIWRKKLDSTNNWNIVKKSFSNGKREIKVATNARHEIDREIEEITITDELANIEQLILKNRYKHYGSSGSLTSEIVDAIPVNFAGGLFAFYSSGHKVVTVTDIIMQVDNQIQLKRPEMLEVGDFIVIRETQQDIIREIADRILALEGKAGLRNIAHKWKESLEAELLHSSVTEIYQKLKNVGCTRDFLTVKNWVMNDDLIIPQKLDDLRNIAAATNDVILFEKAELIYTAGREVITAHTKAGKLLSERLKHKITKILKDMGEFDPLNIWDPIMLQLEDIGYAKILKIIDIGSLIPIERKNTNRLLAE